VATTTSTANVDFVKSLGADIVVDYKKERFEEVLRDCDVVLNSLDADTLKRSLQVLKPGGKLVSISGPPDPAFAQQLGLNPVLGLVMRVMSHGIRKQAARRQVAYSFLFMRASGAQLQQITALLESGSIRPVVDRVFPFESTLQALAYVDTGRAKGKVVVKLK
jgi:alcohol dehydrogenase